MRPPREHATSNGQTYMITSSTWGRRPLFSCDGWAKLLIDTLFHYRGSAYSLHEFVVMPDHVHILLTPKTSLEKAVQFIKGGFSYRAKKALGSNMDVWQKGFSDHRIRDANDYRLHQDGTARLEGAPFQNKTANGAAAGSGRRPAGAVETAPFQRDERKTAS